MGDAGDALLGRAEVEKSLCVFESWFWLFNSDCELVVGRGVLHQIGLTGELLGAAHSCSG